MFRRAFSAIGGLVVVFHAWLFGSQLCEGQLADPSLAMRWVIAAGLVAALAGLRQSGASLAWGRQTVCVWLLAALLHGPAMAADPTRQAAPALPETVTAVLKIAAASVFGGVGLALLAALAVTLIFRPSARHRLVLVPRRAVSGLERSSRFAPRPPPVRSFVRC
jgi:hypothetical protein